MIKFIVNSVITVVITTCTLFLIIFMLLSSTFLNENYNIKCLNDTNYISKSEADIRDSLSNLGASTGISDDIIRGAVSSDNLRSETYRYYSSMCSYLKAGTGKFDYTVDTKGFQDNFTQMIMNDLSGKHIIVDKSGEQGIGTFVKESGKTYSNMITVNTDMIKLYNKFFSIYIRYKIQVLLILVFSVLLLILLNLKGFVYLRYLSAGITIAGVIILVAYALAVFSGITQKLNLEPDYYKKMTEAVISGFLNLSLIYGSIITVIGFISDFLTNKFFVRLAESKNLGV